MIFDAGLLGRAWASVAIAASTDRDDVMFRGAVAVEYFADGVRLVATDRMVILTAWVPDIAHPDVGPPEWDDAPKQTVVALDGDGRGGSLLAYGLLLATAASEDAWTQEVELSIGGAEEDEANRQLQMPGLHGDVLVLSLPTWEHVNVGLYEGDWPNWRDVFGRFAARRTTGIALMPKIIKRLSRLGDFHPDQPLVWRFGGENRAIGLTIGTPPGLVVEGRVMPAPWRFGPEPDAE